MSNKLQTSIETEARCASYTGLGFMSESADSPLQQEYQRFFRGKLAEYEVTSPSELDDEQMRKFFDEVKQDWAIRKARVTKDSDA